MVKSKSLKSILTGTLIGASAILPTLLDAADFKVYNYAPSSSIYDGYLTISTTQDTTPYTPSFPADSLEIWNLSGVSNKVANADITVSKTLTNQLSYKGTVSNGTTNSVRFSGVTNYSSNVLFTYVNQEKSGVSVGDCRKIIVEGNGSRGDVPLSTISNAVNGQIYATNLVNIAPIETSITNFVRNADGTVKLEGKARPGTVLWPEYSTNLLNSSGWTAMSNQAKYVAVTTNNFGGYDGFSYTNLTATNSPMFFRMGCDSYNSGTSNLLANSQAQSVKSLESAVDSTNKTNIVGTGGSSTFKVLREYCGK